MFLCFSSGALLLKNIGNKDDPITVEWEILFPLANMTYWSPMRMGVIVNVTCCKFRQSNNKDLYVSYIIVFILLGLILDIILNSLSQMKAYNFLNPRKIAIQHLNLFLPSNELKHGQWDELTFRDSPWNVSFWIKLYPPPPPKIVIGLYLALIFPFF